MSAPITVSAIAKYAAIAGLVITNFSSGEPWYCQVFYWVCR